MFGEGNFGWTWFLWFGFLIILFSSFGNWGYTYRLHRRFPAAPKAAIDILDERYVRGEIARDEYALMKSEIAGTPVAQTAR